MLATGYALPEVKEAHVDELGNEVGRHGGDNYADGVAEDHSVGLVVDFGEGEGRPDSAQPNDEQDEEERRESAVDDVVGAALSVEFAEEVRDEKGEGVRKDADRDDEGFEAEVDFDEFVGNQVAHHQRGDEKGAKGHVGSQVAALERALVEFEVV